MTPSGIEPATCRFVAYCLNHYVTARPVFFKATIYFAIHISLYISFITYNSICAQTFSCEAKKRFCSLLKATHPHPLIIANKK